jgi:hypothetical protein
VSIKRSLFKSNAASIAHTKQAYLGGFSSGGAVDIMANEQLHFSIEDSSFVGSSLRSSVADETGGLSQGGHLHLASYHWLSTAEVRNTTFSNGTAIASAGTPAEGSIGGYCNGGAIAFHGSHLFTIEDSVFDNNQCVGGQGGALGGSSLGGALHYNTDSVGAVDRTVGLIVERSMFSHSKAMSAKAPHDFRDRSSGASVGGAVMIHLGLDAQKHIVLIKDSQFESNKAIAAAGGSLTGGALAIFVSPVPGRNQTLTAMRNISVSGCTFTRNKVDQDGYAEALASIGMGGAIYFSPRVPDVRTAPLTIENTIFVDNSALGGGCASDTCAPGSALGGALMIQQPRGVDYDSRTAIPEVTPLPFVTFITNSTFRNNGAICGGHRSGGTAGLSCKSSGGAIYVPDDLIAAISVDQTVFDANYALALADRSSAQGGAVCAPRIYATVSEFMNSFCGDSSLDPLDPEGALVAAGGALYADAVIGSQLSFLNNTALAQTAYGGSIASIKIVLNQSSFDDDLVNSINNGACVGGSIYVYQPPDATYGTSGAAVDLDHVSFSGTRAEASRSEAELDKSGGGALYIAGRVQRITMKHVDFFNSTSSHNGGAVYFGHFYDSNRLPSPLSIDLHDVTFTNCSAGGGGGAAFFAYVESWPTNGSAAAAVCSDPTQFSFDSGSAVYGPDCASPPVSMQFAPPIGPDHVIPLAVWPGQTFWTSIVLIDEFNNTVVTESIKILAQVNAGDLHTPLGKNTATASATGLFEFPRVSIVAPLNTTIVLSFIPNKLSEMMLQSSIIMAGCPPSYYSVDLGAGILDCVPCPRFQYNFGNSFSCVECPDELISIKDLREVTQEAAEGAFCMQPPPLNRNGTWNVIKGFYPVPSLANPSEVLECPNPQACHEFNCSLVYDDAAAQWQTDCSACPADFNPESGLDCHCARGHKGRLCAQCICPNDTQCWFSSSGEHGSCTLCRPPSTAIIITSLSLLLFSLVAFLLFNQSAIALFVAEFIVVIVLVILGIAEAWLFDVTIILGLLFLISQASKPRKPKKPSQDDKSKLLNSDGSPRRLGASGGISVPSVSIDVSQDTADEAEAASIVRSHVRNSVQAETAVIPDEPSTREGKIESVSGLVKVLIFFLQTTSVLISSNAWPTWSSDFVVRLSALNVHVSGLECFSPAWFADPFGRFIFLMSLPWIIALALVFSAGGAKLLSKLGVKKATKACWKSFKTKVRPPKKKKVKLARKRSFIGPPPRPFLQPSDAVPSSAATDIASRPRGDSDGLMATSASSPSSLGTSWGARKRMQRYEEPTNVALREDDAEEGLLGSSSSSVPEDQRPLLSSSSSSSSTAALRPDEMAVLPTPEKKLKKKKKKIRKGTLVERIIYSVLFLLFASHFEISNSILSIIKPCSEGYMKDFPWIPCKWSDPQFAMLTGSAAAFFVIYLVGIPALFFAMLYKYRTRIQDKDWEVRYKIGFLYETYRHPVFWFEMIWLARRVLLSISISLIPNTTTFRTAAIVLLLLASLFIQRNFMPFNSSLANWLEVASITIILYSYIVGGQLNKLPGDFGTVKEIMQNLLWVLNALIVLALVGAILSRPIGKVFSFWCGKKSRFKNQMDGITGPRQE